MKKDVLFKIVIGCMLLFLSGYGSEQTQSYASILREVAQKKSSIEREINSLNFSKVNQYLSHEFDNFWFSNNVRNLFNEHYLKVKNTLRHVYLNKKYGNTEVVTAQYSSIVDDKKLNEMSTQFVKDAMIEIQSLQEELMNNVFTEFTKYANSKILDIEKQIAQKFDEVIANKFQYYPKTFISLSPHFVEASQINSNVNSINPNVGKAGIAGATILIMRKKIVKVLSRKIVAKMGGKALAKLIPGIGWALLALEVADAAQAKENFEKQLREMFFKQYVGSMTPQVVWKNNRANAIQKSELTLNKWFIAQKRTIENLLEAATLMEKPSFREYANSRLKSGATTAEIASELRDLQINFGNLSQQLTIDQMYEILASLPVGAPKSIIPEAINIFGNSFVDYYKKYGSNYLASIYHMGAQNTKYLLSNNYDIQEIENMFLKYLNHQSSEAAKKGFFLAIKNKFSLNEDMNEEFFKNLSLYINLAIQMKDTGISLQKIQKILSNTTTLEIVNTIYQNDPILAKEFTKKLSIIQMVSRYKDMKKINLLMNMYDTFYKEKSEQNAKKLVKMTISDPKILTVFSEYGKDGLHLYKHYVTKNSGKHHQELAEKALALYGNEYNLEKLYDAEYVNKAYSFIGIPFGKTLLNLFYPVIQYIGAIGFLVLFLIVLSLLVLMLKVLLSLKTKKEIIQHSGTQKYNEQSIEVEPIEPVQYDLNKVKKE